LPTHGGRLELSAGNDVKGAAVSQSVGEWQTRQGRATTAPPGWGTDFRRFAWNAGTFGGGDIVVRAGHDIGDLSVAAADSASMVDNHVNRYGGGVLAVDAEHDITSAYVHVTRGNNRLRAGGELGRSRESDTGLLGSVFSMQEASLDLNARRGIALESVFNPTLLVQSQQGNNFRSFFMSYAPDSRLRAHDCDRPHRDGHHTGTADRLPRRFRRQQSRRQGTACDTSTERDDARDRWRPGLRGRLDHGAVR
jgi:hypothetical protein